MLKKVNCRDNEPICGTQGLEMRKGLTTKKLHREIFTVMKLCYVVLDGKYTTLHFLELCTVTNNFY